MAFYLGIDMGSSSIKANVTDENGHVVTKAKTAVTVLNPRDGFFEIDCEKTWWEGFVEITRQVSQYVPINEIAAICISSLCGTFVPVDKDFKPLTNAILYSIDTRSKTQVEKLNSLFGEQRLQNELGGVFTTHSTIPKILWIKENLPEIYEKTAFFVESNNYVSMKLTHKVAWDFPSAIGSQLVNIKEQKAADAIIKEIGLDPQKVPQMNYVTDILGNVCTKEAFDLGYKESTVVMTGGCDINAEAMSIGAVNPGDMLVVYGSTMSTLMTLSEFIMMKGFRTGMSVRKGTYRLGTASASGARHLKWIDAMIGKECEIDLTALPTGIMMLPYLDGARSPFDNPAAEPVIIGLKDNTTLNDIAVSAREALGYEVQMLIDMLGRKGIKPEMINCTGGLTNIRPLMQIVADITGKPQRLFRSTDASFGDAFIAMSAERDFQTLMKLPGISKMFTPDEIIEPDAERHKKYAPYAKKYTGLYDIIKPVFD